jgi:hypothetical protein
MGWNGPIDLLAPPSGTPVFLPDDDGQEDAVYIPGERGATGAPGSAIPGMAGEEHQEDAVYIPGQTGPAGSASTVPGPAIYTVAEEIHEDYFGPPGPASVVPGPQGPAGIPILSWMEEVHDDYFGPPGPASTVSGPQGVPGPAVLSYMEEYHDDFRQVIPGLPGPQGNQGPAIPGMPGDEYYDDPLPIPGQTGPAGPASTIPGPAIYTVAEEIHEDTLGFPGLQGIQGIQGLIGQSIALIHDDGSTEDPLLIYPTYQANSLVSANLLRGYIDGLTLSWLIAVHGSITFAAGIARDDTDTITMVNPGATFTKSNAAWAAGNTNGGSDSGALLLASTWYHCYMISTGNTVDFLFSTSATSPTMPTGYIYKRRIGSAKTDGASLFVGFIANGGYFQWQVPTADIASTNPGTGAVSRTLTVPLGVRVLAELGVGTTGNTLTDDPGGIFISDLSVADSTASITGAFTSAMYSGAAALTQGGCTRNVWTNTSQQVRSRLAISSTNTVLYISTLGWFDPRGQNS